MVCNSRLKWSCDCAGVPLSIETMARDRERWIRKYFLDGHSYRVVLILLGHIHGYQLSIRQLKRILRNMGLRRRTGLPDSILRRLINVSMSSRTIAKVIAINIVQLELQGSSILLGYRALWRRLQSYGIPASRFN